MKFIYQLSLSHKGSSIPTVLMLLGGVALGTSALMTINKGMMKSRARSEKSQLGQRINETALQTVSQLVNNGALHFNNACSRLEPALQTNASGSSFNPDYQLNGCNPVTALRAAINCSGMPLGDSTWQYQNDASSGDVIINLCIPSTEKKGTSSVTTNVPVKVKIMRYDLATDAANNQRRVAFAKSQPVGLNNQGDAYPALDGQISLGLVQGNVGLISKYSANDFCYYMRPKTTRQSGSNNLTFNAKVATGAYTLSELEPRPDGPNADEFQQRFDFNTPLPGSYEVLPDYRNRLINNYFRQNYRGNRPATENWTTVADAVVPRDAGGLRDPYQTRIITADDWINDPTNPRAHFVGVMPQIPNGPQFQYFLAATPGTANHRHDRRAFDPQFFDEFRQGCATTTGDSRPSFCTRIDIPLRSYRASFVNRCRQVRNRLPAVGINAVPRKYYVNRAIQTSCNPAWLRAVENYLASRVDPFVMSPVPNPNEMTAVMVMQALEVDDDFIQRRGPWANHPFRAEYDSFNAVNYGSRVRNIDDYTIEFTGDQDRAEQETTQVNGQDVVRTRITYDARDEFINVYQIDVLHGFRDEQHTSRSCAYFKYNNPDSPKLCSIEYVNRTQAGYVCRNQDGCFDEQTMIRMADGSDRLVTQLRIGEYVFNPVTKKPAKISKLTIGPESKPLIHISVGNAMVRVTETHPFMTKRGWVTAKSLNQSDRVLSAKGDYEQILKIEKGASGRTVANLALDGPIYQEELHYVLADGIITGDLSIQNMLESVVTNNDSKLKSTAPKK